jgi:hypothetical protein
VLDFGPAASPGRLWRLDLDVPDHPPPAATDRAQAFTLWPRGRDLGARRREAASCIRRLLSDNPFTTLQVVLDPTGLAACRTVTPDLLEALAAVCQEQPTYLDTFYALQPGRPNGAKRLVVLLPGDQRGRLSAEWVEGIGSLATVVWRGRPPGPPRTDLQAYEYAWAP